MKNKQCSKERYEEELRINWQTAYKDHLTYRELLQILGTNLLRNQLHENVWVNALFSKYKLIANIPDENAKLIKLDEYRNIYDNYNKEVYPNWIITDCRFPNEAEAIKQKGGILIRIERNPYLKSTPKSKEEITNIVSHTSETALDTYEFDYTIANNGTINELIENVKNILIHEKIITN